jgi:hypothetical protein
MKTFQVKVVEKIETDILHPITFFQSSAVFEKISKTLVEPETPQIIWLLRAAYWISKATRAQAHVRALQLHTQTHAHTHPHAVAHFGASAHKQKYVIIFAFPQQQWFRECAPLLRYTYIACIVDV